MNIGLLVTFLLGLQKDSLDLGRLDTSAFVVAFPLIGSLLQLIILPFCPDSPASLGELNIGHDHGKRIKLIEFSVSQSIEIIIDVGNIFWS